MTRDEAKELAKEDIKTIQSFIDEQTIEFYNPKEEWQKVHDYIFLIYCLNNGIQLRIKPEQQYRAFRDAKEFEPFRDRWVKSIDETNHIQYRITSFDDRGVWMDNNDRLKTFKLLYEIYTFDDGTPFGCLDEVQDEG